MFCHTSGGQKSEIHILSRATPPLKAVGVTPSLPLWPLVAASITWLTAASLQSLPLSSQKTSHGLLHSLSLGGFFLFCLLEGHLSLDLGPALIQMISLKILTLITSA